MINIYIYIIIILYYIYMTMCVCARSHTYRTKLRMDKGWDIQPSFCLEERWVLTVLLPQVRLIEVPWTSTVSLKWDGLGQMKNLTLSSQSLQGNLSDFQLLRNYFRVAGLFIPDLESREDTSHPLGYGSEICALNP